MSIDFGALTRIKNNLQLRGLKEAAPGDKAANEQAVKQFLEENRQTIIDLSLAEIKTDQPDAATIKWMNKLIRLAETYTTQFGNNIVNRLDNPDNGATGSLIKHDGGDMALTLHEGFLSTDDLLLFVVDQEANGQLTISVTASPKNNPKISGRRTLAFNTKPGQIITEDDIELSSANQQNPD